MTLGVRTTAVGVTDDHWESGTARHCRSACGFSFCVQSTICWGERLLLLLSVLWVSGGAWTRTIAPIVISLDSGGVSGGERGFHWTAGVPAAVDTRRVISLTSACRHVRASTERSITKCVTDGQRPTPPNQDSVSAVRLLLTPLSRSTALPRRFVCHCYWTQRCG